MAWHTAVSSQRLARCLASAAEDSSSTWTRNLHKVRSGFFFYEKVPSCFYHVSVEIREIVEFQFLLAGEFLQWPPRMILHLDVWWPRSSHGHKSSSMVQAEFREPLNLFLTSLQQQHVAGASRPAMMTLFWSIIKKKTRLTIIQWALQILFLFLFFIVALAWPYSINM